MVFRFQIRTKNDVEGWHLHLCSHAGQKYFISWLNLYLLIEVLYLEAQQTDINAAMLLQGHQLRREKGPYRLLNSKLFELWDSHNNGAVSTEVMLEICALLCTKHNKFSTRKNADDTRYDLDEEIEVDEAEEEEVIVEVVEALDVIDSPESSLSSEG